MKTIVYLIRHSEPLKDINNIINNDNLQLQNEKACLSINGEILANKISKLEELKNIDVLFSSNYVRTISTAKYIANENNLNELIKLGGKEQVPFLSDRDNKKLIYESNDIIEYLKNRG